MATLDDIWGEQNTNRTSSVNSKYNKLKPFKQPKPDKTFYTRANESNGIYFESTDPNNEKMDAMYIKIQDPIAIDYLRNYSANFHTYTITDYIKSSLMNLIENEKTENFTNKGESLKREHFQPDSISERTILIYVIIGLIVLLFFEKCKQLIGK